MRLPFFQMTQDALVRARTMAGILKIPAAHGIGLAASLFVWALEMATSDDLTGQIADENPAEVVAAAVGWDGDAIKLYSAMCRVGFIERSQKLEDGFDRVRGLDRYADALALPSKRSDAGKIGAAKRWQRPSNPMANDGQTQTQTQTHKETPPSEECAERTPPPEKPFELSSDPPKPTRRRSDAQQFFDWGQPERSRVTGLVAEAEPDPGKLNAWFPKAVEVSGSVERLQIAYANYILHPRDDYWTKRRFPFKGFMSQFRDYLPPAERAA